MQPTRRIFRGALSGPRTFAVIGRPCTERPINTCLASATGEAASAASTHSATASVKEDRREARNRLHVATQIGRLSNQCSANGSSSNAGTSTYPAERYIVTGRPSASRSSETILGHGAGLLSP